MTAFAQAPTAVFPDADTGKTIAGVSTEEGHYYDLLGRVLPVNRCTISYTDGTSTVLDLADGIRYSSTGFIPGPGSPGIPAYLDAVEANLARKAAAAQAAGGDTQVAP